MTTTTRPLTLPTFSPTALTALPYATPFLYIDLGQVQSAYDAFRTALPQVRVHYAMKCNPERRIIARLHETGSSFEIASLYELEELRAIGVAPSDVLFSNPVKMPEHIQKTYAAGLYRFSFDSKDELDKIAKYAPGASVYVRLQTQPANSGVASEGKFGIDATQAFTLMTYAKLLGLKPYGIGFHVGSQMHDPTTWDVAIQQSAKLMRKLQQAGIILDMLDMGGGFPAYYTDSIPTLNTFAECINRALTHYLPYDVELVIEPGRALVGEAGVMVATVIGRAERKDQQWLHLDVGAFNGMMEALETQNQLSFPLGDSKDSLAKTTYHLTGPSCDSQDTIMFNVTLSENLESGDRVFIYTAGAYTTSYASRFNGFDIPSVQFVA